MMWVFVTSPADIPKIQDALTCNTATSGVRVNIGKSKAIAFCTGDTFTKIIDIPYHTETYSLGFLFTASLPGSARKIWSRATAFIRAQAKDAYYRELILDKGINDIREYPLGKVWYPTQIYPPSGDSVRQLNKWISCFIWKGQIFRFPMSTLHKKNKVGVWDLINMKANVCALFLYRMRTQYKGSRTVTWEWIRTWI